MNTLLVFVVAYIAITIAIATVVTRAHYVVDVVSGVALAVAVWAIARAAGLKRSI